MIGIEKPRIETADLLADGTYGKFIVEPLERGYGTTLGNSLRRVAAFLSAGYAITSVKIDGLSTSFSTVEGVKRTLPRLF
jgi:DNA-directed RNA polymerase subunit alpha